MPNKTLTFQEWSENFSKMLIDETFKLLDSQTKTKEGGFIAKRYIVMTFISMFVEAMMTKALTERKDPNASHEALFKEAYKNFSTTKLKLQEAVALGVQRAMQNFSGKNLEYYCVVVPTPEPLNKTPV